MILDQSHVGKKVRLDQGEIFQLVAVDNEDVWIKDASFNHGTYENNGRWVIVEPQKKPSERINELVNLNTPSSLTSAYSVVEAIKKYLDEEYEKSEKRDK